MASRTILIIRQRESELLILYFFRLTSLDENTTGMTQT
jgi:hypothetical protein